MADAVIQLALTAAAVEHLLPRTDGGYSCNEVANVTLGEFTGRVWRHGLGKNPQRLRELADVALATADELEEAWARQRHPAGSRRTA